MKSLLSITRIFLMLNFVIFNLQPYLWCAKAKVNEKLNITTDGATEGQVIVATNVVNNKGNTVLKPVWTTLTVPDNSVNSATVQDGTIAGVDIANGAITGGKIQDGSITNSDIADNSITNEKVVSIDGSKLVDESVDTTKLVPGVIPVTYVVQADGNGNYDTIEEALTNMPSTGGKIMVSSGTYSVTTIGISTSSVIIEGMGNSSIIQSSGTAFDINANNVIIKNLAIESDSVSDAVIAVAGTHNKVESCIIEGGNRGIEASSADELQIFTNTISSQASSYIGIGINTSNRVMIRSNFITTANNASNQGIFVDAISLKTTIIGNQINHQSGEGIVLDGAISPQSSAFTLVTDNVLSGTGVGIESTQWKVIISGNVIADSSTDSVVLGAGSTKNIVTANALDGDIESQTATPAYHAIFSNIAKDINVTDTATQPGNVSGGSSVDDLDEHNSIN